VLAEDVRQAVIADVDSKVAEKMKDLWSRGNVLMKQIEQEHQQKTSDLLTGLTKCREKQESLSAEHETLRLTLAGMVHQFHLIGEAFGAPVVAAQQRVTHKAAPPTPAAPICLGSSLPGNAPGSVDSTTASCGASSASGSAAGGLQDSPLEFCAGNLGAPQLPTLPDFPFQGATGPSPSVATPLSLAEALGTEATATPLSLSNSISPSFEPQAKVFSFTLRKADGTDLGLNVSHMEHDKVLRVEGVRAEGAVEAWNRQCEFGIPEKAVLPGDRIISVNGVVYDPAKMLEECRDRQLLKITIARGEGALPGLPSNTKAEAKTPTTLRADASEFVPTGLVPEQAVKKEETVSTDAPPAL
jgi:hypothetical protein